MSFCSLIKGITPNICSNKCALFWTFYVFRLTDILSTNENLSSSWQFPETCGVTSYGGGWRKDVTVVNHAGSLPEPFTSSIVTARARVCLCVLSLLTTSAFQPTLSFVSRQLYSWVSKMADVKRRMAEAQKVMDNIAHVNGVPPPPRLQQALDNSETASSDRAAVSPLALFHVPRLLLWYKMLYFCWWVSSPWLFAAFGWTGAAHFERCQGVCFHWELRYAVCRPQSLMALLSLASYCLQPQRLTS